MTKILSIALLIVFLIPNGTEWLMQQGFITQMFLHHFFHGNIFHLCANIFCIVFSFRYAKPWHLIPTYFIASVSILASSMPVVGFSNMIYAMIGLRSPSFTSKWWRQPGTIMFLVITAAMFLFRNVSAITHIISFVGGVMMSVSLRWLQKIQHDSARYI